MQGWKAISRHGVTRKTGNLFRKTVQMEVVHPHQNYKENQTNKSKLSS